MFHRQYPEHPNNVIGYLRRGTLEQTDDSGTQQLLQVRGLASEQLKKIVRVLPHGFSSHAPKDSEGVFLSLGGRSDRVLGLGYEHKDKRQKDLPEGTAVLYDANGNILFAKGSNGIAIDAKEGKVYVKPAEGKNVYLGGTGDDGKYSKVLTVDGPAKNVFARVS